LGVSDGLLQVLGHSVSLYVYNDANDNKTHTSSNVAGMNRMWQTIVEYTHTLTLL